MKALLALCLFCAPLFIVSGASSSNGEKAFAERLAKRQYERSTNCHPGKDGCVIRVSERTRCRRGTCVVHLEGNPDEAWGEYRVRGGHVVFESLFQEVFVDCKDRG